MGQRDHMIALDAGGTMTDTFLIDDEGHLHLGKALTDHQDESRSYVASVADACSYSNISSTFLHRNAILSCYTGTTMLNILLTGAGSRVGLITSKAMASLPYTERGLTWLHLDYQERLHIGLDEHSPSLVDIRLVKPVAELIKGATLYTGCHLNPGTVVCPLNEGQVSRAAGELLDAGVEVIGIIFLNSYLNPAHELKAKEIVEAEVKRRGRDVRTVTSYEICPVSMESQRLKTLLINCFCTTEAARQLFVVEKAAKNDGFPHELQTLLSYGASANIRYPKLHEAIASGPTGGLLGTKALLTDLMGEPNVLATDLGGTSYDAGLIVDGLLPVKDDPHFYYHKLNLPMLAIDSIGAGTGQVIHVDPLIKRIDLGPESAGSSLGTCYGYPDITIGDVDLVLGYLNPDNFLGGQVKLDKERAQVALQQRLADPLGEELYQVSSRTLDLLHVNMREHLKTIMLSRGLESKDFVLNVYGGSGPMHLWGIAEDMEFKAVVTCPWAAAFSAFGVATADYFHRYEASVLVTLFPAIPDTYKVAMAQTLNAQWQALEEKAFAELAAEGFGRREISLQYGIRARYIGQWSSWEAPVSRGRIETIEDLNALVAAFENVYAVQYPVAARFPEAGHAITGVYLIAKAAKPKPTIREYPLSGSVPQKAAHKGQRNVYHRKWMTFDIWDIDLLQPGNRVDGPAIVEHPMTTLVVPPENYIEMDQYKLIWYKRR